MVQGTVAGQASFIKSIQHGVVTIAHMGTSGTSAINSVDTTSSVIMTSGTHSTAISHNRDCLCYMTLTNATTVTAARSGNQSQMYVSFIVIEYYSNVVKSIQSGSCSTTDTITAVVVNKSACFNRGPYTSADWTERYSVPAYITLTNSTTVTQAGFDPNVTNYYTVVEFY